MIYFILTIDVFLNVCIVADFIALGYVWAIPIVCLGSKEKSYDPLLIPNSGRNILQAILKNLNLALKVANPSLKHDVSIWGCKVHGVPTNSIGYESCQCITIFIDSFNTQCNFFIHAVLCRVMWFSISCIHGLRERYIFQYLW